MVDYFTLGVEGRGGGGGMYHPSITLELKQRFPCVYQFLLYISEEDEHLLE